MSERTGIAWTDHTFNIAWGCERVSPGCAHCYAETLAKRYGFKVWGPKTADRRTFGEKHWTEPLRWNAKAEKDGVRRRVFCSSMADVFEDNPTIAREREKLWPLIRATPWLDWQFLTKRPDRIAANLPLDWGEEGYPNVWLGTSVENQRWRVRAEILATVPARVRFISAEPLLGMLSFRWMPGGRYSPCVFNGRETTHLGHLDAFAQQLHWVIVGGESGPKCRPMNPDWARIIRDECAEAGVPFFLKQLGGMNPRAHDCALLDGQTHTEMPSVTNPATPSCEKVSPVTPSPMGPGGIEPPTVGL